MTNIQLSVAIDKNPRTKALLTDWVRPDGIDIDYRSGLRGQAIADYQLQTREFDVCDMSLTSTYTLNDKGDDTLVPLPVFTLRHFFHTDTYIRLDRGIDSPQDLSGKRIGLAGYGSGSSLWCLGAFQHELKVDLASAELFTDDNSLNNSLGGGALKITKIGSGDSLATLLLQGELDAVMNLSSPDSVLVEESGIRRLFLEPAEEGARYFNNTNVYPSQYCIVVKRELLDQEPWVLKSLYDAFVASGDFLRPTAHQLEPFVETGIISEEIRSALSINPYPFGLGENSIMLQTFGQYCSEQGYTSSVLSPERVFETWNRACL